MSSTSIPFPTHPQEFALVDVFAEHPLEGNMLAIFPNCHLTLPQHMQALARAMNLPETTFIASGSDPNDDVERGVAVRIFTTEEELPFAGHPTLGTAAWLYWNHPLLRGSEAITLRLKSGPITVRFEPPAPGEAGVFGTMRQQDPIFGRTHSHQAVAAALNVPLADLDLDTPIQTVSTGMPFCIVVMRSLEAIGRLSIPQAVAQAYLAKSDAKFFYCTTRASPASGADFHARMQFYNGEDPATGSASGCAIAFLVRHGLVPSGRPTLFEQGVEIGRPSRIHVRASVCDGRVAEVFVGGRTIPVASGRFFDR